MASPRVGGDGSRLRGQNNPFRVRGAGVLDTGTGAFAARAASFSGTGTETITGTGAFAAAPAVLLGASTQVVTGSGVFAGGAASFAGAGSATDTTPIHTGSRKRKPLEFKPVPVPIIIGRGGFLAAPASLHGVGERGPDPVLFLDDELLLLLV